MIWVYTYCTIGSYSPFILNKKMKSHTGYSYNSNMFNKNTHTSNERIAGANKSQIVNEMKENEGWSRILLFGSAQPTQKYEAKGGFTGGYAPNGGNLGFPTDDRNREPNVSPTTPSFNSFFNKGWGRRGTIGFPTDDRIFLNGMNENDCMFDYSHSHGRNIQEVMYGTNYINPLERIAGANKSQTADEGWGRKGNIGFPTDDRSRETKVSPTTPSFVNKTDEGEMKENVMMANHGYSTPSPPPPPPPPCPPVPPSLSYPTSVSKYSVFKGNKWHEEHKINKRSSFFLSDSAPKKSTKTPNTEFSKESSISSYSHSHKGSSPPRYDSSSRSQSTSTSLPNYTPSNYCNNCGRVGHGFYQCKNPITSYGVIIFRYALNPTTGKKERQYLMIRRRDTIAYVDFMRGKYSISNRKYIKTLVKDMTEYEQDQLMTQSFEYLWCELWKNNEPNPRDKIRMSQEKWKHSGIKEGGATTGPDTLSKFAGANSGGDDPPPFVEEEKDDMEPESDVYCENERIAGANKSQIVNEMKENEGWGRILLFGSAQPTQKYEAKGGFTGGYAPNGGNLGFPTDDRIFLNEMKENGKMNTKDKFNILQKGLAFNQKKHFTIAEIVEEVRKEQKFMSTEPWKEPEWGFCKGRRNYKENDYDCAVREMQEETGYSRDSMTPVKNINTFEEIFIGSNFKCYKHKYYLMYMTYEDSLKTGSFEKTEVSCIRWASLNECLSLIRSYNVEKKRMITNVENALSNYTIFESR